jgi:hypothetical protein
MTNILELHIDPSNLSLVADMSQTTFVITQYPLLSTVSFSKPWGLGCAKYQYEQRWLAYDRAASRAVVLLIRRAY